MSDIEKFTLKGLTLIVTDACNYNCFYCPQKKENKHMEISTIEKTIDFFYPYFPEDYGDISFFGGEPLLVFDRVKHAVNYSLAKNTETVNREWRFSLTTNGSLLTDEMLEFFDEHKFVFSISFDGLMQDIGRKRGSFDATCRAIENARKYEKLKFAVMSVFYPQTVSNIFESLKFIIESGVPKIYFFLSFVQPWGRQELDTLKDQWERLTDYMIDYYKANGTTPIESYSFKPEREKPKGKFGCSGGREQMAVSLDECVWGCSAFYDYLKDKKETEAYRDYCFGVLDDLKTDFRTVYPTILSNIAELRQDYFFTEKDFCYLCDDIMGCAVCPVNLAYVTSMIGKIPSYMCEINKIKNSALRRFKKEFEL